MNKLLVIITILTAQLLNSQEINSRKGQFFASFGVNRSFYSNSDVTFTGKDFEITLYNAKADDISYLEPKGLSAKYSNLKLGYFFSNHYNFVLGSDNMRYVLRNGQNFKLKGKIATGDYLYDGTLFNYDDVYNYRVTPLSNSFLLYKHDALNYIFAGVNRFDNLNKLLHINTDKFEVNIEEGFDFGLVMPKTSTTILGNEQYETSGVAGYGLSANAGLNLTFFKHFFIKAAIKYGYIDLKDIRVSNDDASANVKQHFDFMETSYSFGLRFQVFTPKKKMNKKVQSKDILDSEKEISVSKEVTPDLKSDKKEREIVDIEVEKNINITICPGDKSIEYREKSKNATNIQTQKGYSWIALYYDYKCKCDNGSLRPEDLVVIINNVVDSYLENTNGIYGELTKVTKCRPLSKN